MSSINGLGAWPNQNALRLMPLYQVLGVCQVICRTCTPFLLISYCRIVHVASAILLEARIGSSGGLVYGYFVARPASLRISSLLASASFCCVFPAARAAFFLRSSSSLTTTQTKALSALCLASTRHVLQLNYLQGH